MSFVTLMPDFSTGNLSEIHLQQFVLCFYPEEPRKVSTRSFEFQRAKTFQAKEFNLTLQIH